MKSALLKILARRLLALPLSIWVLITLTFGLVALMPGNPAVAVAGLFATPDEISRLETLMGLDRPFADRYFGYLKGVLTGDLGRSFFTDRSVGDEILHRLPATLELVICALIVAALIGLALGSISALLGTSMIGRFVRTCITALQSIPDFLLTLLFIFTFFYLLRLAPAPVGQLGPTHTVPTRTGAALVDTLLDGRFDLFIDAFKHLAIPVAALGLVYSAFIGKVTDSAMRTALRSPQVEFAKACGLSKARILQYAFVEARLPVVTYGAILFGGLLGGVTIVETIISWQGMGQWALEAILRVDVPVIQGFILVTGTATILIYLGLDILIATLDPRIRYE